MIRLMALAALLVLSGGVISAESGSGLTSTLNTVTTVATTTLQTDSTTRYDERKYDDRDDSWSGSTSGSGDYSWSSSNSGSGSYSSGSSGSGSSGSSSGSGTSGTSNTSVTTVISNTEPIPTQTTVVVSTVVPVQPNDAAPRILKEEPVDDARSSRSGEGSDATVWRQPVPQPTAPPAQPTRSTNQGSSAELSSVGKSLREFSREARIIETAVQTSVSEEVDRAIQHARITSKVFDIAERERRLEELKTKIMRRQEAFTSEVRTTITSGVQGPELDDLQPALRSSLEDIELLIEAETGAEVDLSGSARAITEVVQGRTERIAAARKDLLARDGLELYTDTDNDGVSDYDESKIYRTDPHNAYTAGSTLTDGERILLGFDVHSTTTGRVAVESPKIAGEVVEGVFEVYSIEVKPAASLPEQQASQGPTKTITFAGRALPNSFVTLYIFSTPVIVTVKTDSSGAWTYTLDRELEDGAHELHVATVDDSGRILAKSPVIPFVMVAEAAEFTPLIVPTTPEIDPLDILHSNLLLVVGIALVLFAIAAMGILGMRKKPDGQDMA